MTEKELDQSGYEPFRNRCYLEQDGRGWQHHRDYVQAAHVVQEWQVDGNGEFTKVLQDCVEVSHKPNRDDYFVCMTCGTQAHIE